MASVQKDNNELISKIPDFSSVDFKFSRVRIVKATFLWKVKNIYSRFQFSAKKEIESKILKIDEERFHVQLTEGDTSNYLFVCLYPATQCEKDILVKFQFSILDDKGEEYNGQIVQCLYPVSSKFGCRCLLYIHKRNLFTYRKRFLPNDIFTFRLELSVVSDTQSIFFLGADNTKLCHSKLIQDFSTLLRDSKNFDCIISVEKKKIKVHKAFLFARSPVFASELQREINIPVKEITIDDFEFKIVKRMVNFIYTGEIPEVGVESLLSLLAISQRYDIKDLKILCQERLMWNLRIENATSIFKAACEYDASDLKIYCLEYFSENAEFIFKTSERINYASKLPETSSLLLLRLAKAATTATVALVFFLYFRNIYSSLCGA